jgi:cytochrome c-type biogenesis protein CcmE
MMLDKHFVMLFAVIGIVVLYLVSVVSQPEHVTLNDVKNNEGKNVTVKGIVVEKYQTKNGNTIMEIRDDNTNISVFHEGYVNAKIGDEIRVTGRVQKYKNMYEIVASEIEILKKWDKNYIELKQLKSNPEKYEGTNINVTGFAVSIKHNEFYLSDNISKIKVVITKSTSLPPENQKIFVKGKMRYDENMFEYFIELEGHGVLNE